MVAILDSGPTHTGLDNKAVCTKANQLLSLAKSSVEKVYQDYAEPGSEQPYREQKDVAAALEKIAQKSPLKKHWAMQSDGDLWSQYWAMVIHKSPWAIRHTKVKGHATEAMIAEGRTTAETMIPCAACMPLGMSV